MKFESPNNKAEIKLTKQQIDSLEVLGISKEDVERALMGAHNTKGSIGKVYFLGKDNTIALKSSEDPEKQLSYRQEFAVLELLSERGFKHSPKPYIYFDQNNVLMSQAIEGETLQTPTDEDIGDLAKMLGELHLIKSDKFGKLLTERKKGNQLDNLFDGIDQIKNRLEKIRDQRVKEQLELALQKVKGKARQEEVLYSSTSYSLIHFDLHSHNIIKEKNSKKIFIIDWEQASFGDAAMDISKLFLKFKFTPKQKIVFLNSYENLRKDSTLHERIETYTPLVIINSIIWRSNQISRFIKSGNKLGEEKMSKAMLAELTLLNASL